MRILIIIMCLITLPVMAWWGVYLYDYDGSSVDMLEQSFREVDLWEMSQCIDEYAISYVDMVFTLYCENGYFWLDVEDGETGFIVL